MHYAGPSSGEYCLRAVTADDNEIQYSEYIQVDASDVISPVISSYSPEDNFLFPIGNFDMNYTYSDEDSGINTSSYSLALQKWDGTSWGSDISASYESLNSVSSTAASLSISNLPFGRYRATFYIQDNAGNAQFVQHELYVDEVEFSISDSEHDIGNLILGGGLRESDEELTLIVKTV